MSPAGKFSVFFLIALVMGIGSLWILGGRPVQCQAETRIVAPPEVVFDWLVDPQKRMLWVESLKQATVTEPDNNGMPATYHLIYEKDGQQRNLTESVQQLDPGEFFSLRSVERGIRKMQIYRLTREGNAVRVSHERIESTGGLRKLLFALRSKPPVEEIRTDLAKLKRLIEKEHAVPMLFGEPVINPASSAKTSSEKPAPDQ